LLSKPAVEWPGHDRSVSVHQAVDSPSQLGNQVSLARVHLADAVAELGTLLSQLGEFREAESLLRRAVAIYESRPGPDVFRLAAALSALSVACAARGRFGEAERLSRHALQIIDPKAQEQS
jgi:Flp pilus assembly protein TadD